MAIKVVGTKQLRAELPSLIEATSELEQVIVTRYGQGRAVLVDLERYNQLVDRLDFLEESLDAIEGEREGAVPIDELA